MKREKRYYDYPGASPAEVEHYMREARRMRNEVLRAGLATLGRGIRSLVRRLRPAPAGARVGKPSAAAPISGRNASLPRRHQRDNLFPARRQDTTKRKEAA